ENADGKVCVDVDNDRVKIVDTFTARRTCIGHFSGAGGGQTITIVTNDPHLNAMAAMTDAGDYLQTVMNFNMSQISVLTGIQSSILTFANGHASFTPCMGQMPNIFDDLVLAISPSFVFVLGEFAEFFVSYDIVLDAGDVGSRGVPVHEYG